MSKEKTHSRLIEHLIALRSCLLQSFGVVMLFFLALFYFANDLYHALALPLITHLPHGTHMIATSITAPFLIPLKFTFVVSLFLAVPFILWQVWRFVTPGLYQHEKIFLWILFGASLFLFYVGVLFAYFIVCPLLFTVLTRIAPHDVLVMPDMAEYLDFILRFLFAFGVAFEIPIIMVVLIKLGISTVNSLSSKRRYFIVLAFIIGMLLTPDVLSQSLLAIPLCGLFEIGLLAGRYIPIVRQDAKR